MISATERAVKEAINMLRSQVLAAAIIKVIVFWDVAPCSLVEID
jgi:hypothetical protein